jgi:hypothetical protein
MTFDSILWRYCDAGAPASPTSALAGTVVGAPLLAGDLQLAFSDSVATLSSGRPFATRGKCSDDAASAAVARAGPG